MSDTSTKLPPPIQLDRDGFNELRQSRQGLLLYNKNDVYIGKALQKYGESCWIEHSFFPQLIEPGSVVVEVGANIGSHTVGLSSMVGPSGRVLAFEPQRIVFQTLCANVALNQCTNVYAFQEALGAKTGVINVPYMDPKERHNFGGVTLVGASAGEQVRVRTLDDLQLAMCHLLKVDVEGMELDVLTGGLQTIARTRPIMYLENDRTAQSRALLELVFSLGYRAYWHLPPLFNPANIAGDQENIYPGIVSVNVLCVPAERAVTVEHMRQVSSADDDWRAVR